MTACSLVTNRGKENRMGKLIYADNLKAAIEKHKNKSPQGWANIFECCEDSGIDECLSEVESAEPVEAITVDWLLRKADWCNKNNSSLVSHAIKSVVNVWREEQNNGQTD